MISTQYIIAIICIGVLIYIYRSTLFEHYSNYIDGEKLTKRQKTIHLLNSQRGEYGRFKVDCDSCDRSNEYFNTESSIQKECDKNTMSFFNDKYVETSQIYCYNCLISANDKNKEAIQTYGSTYVYDASLNDPNNGAN